MRVHVTLLALAVVLCTVCSAQTPTRTPRAYGDEVRTSSGTVGGYDQQSAYGVGTAVTKDDLKEIKDEISKLRDDMVKRSDLYIIIGLLGAFGLWLFRDVKAVGSTVARHEGQMGIEALKAKVDLMSDRMVMHMDRHDHRLYGHQDPHYSGRTDT